jgi:hypothetical protein
MTEQLLETLLVTVADEALTRISGIAKDLETSGLQVETVAEATGVISGRAPRQLIGVLANVEGVEAVEIARALSLPLTKGEPEGVTRGGESGKR